MAGPAPASKSNVTMEPAYTPPRQARCILAGLEERPIDRDIRVSLVDGLR
ncbi:hypothetical protein GCM10010994_09620 [Chelatococcus reniformis]|uniref:Uncharacterized protein n=1 Tax=Chelatococcus reniformis TaxID=1494448 RepID=A0A916TYU2_9HYPH|nr:hypothetical protein GCM10010994_09620 [Chelatococcus reniformis]